MQKAPVRFYRSSSGDEPARNWLQNLPKTCKKILGEDIATVQYGWPVGMPLVRKLEPNLWDFAVVFPTASPARSSRCTVTKSFYCMAS